MTEQFREPDQQENEETLEDYLGPFYDDGGLMRRYNCTQQDIAAMVQEGVLVAVPTDEDVLLYPIFQFPDQVHPHPDMPAFVQFMKERIDVPNPSVDIALHLKVCPNPYASSSADKDKITTLEMIHAGRIEDAINYWDMYYKGLEGPSGWY